MPEIKERQNLLSETDMHRMSVAIDFDGVIVPAIHEHIYGYFPNELLDGAKDTINKLYDAGWLVIIYSCRVKDEIEEFLIENGIQYDYINVNSEWPSRSNKIKADVYIDDHGLRFEGNWEETYNKLKEIYDF